MLSSGLAKRWLKWGAKPPANGSAEGAPAAKVSRLARESRRELLAAIGDFLLDHDLPICPENLTAACTAFSGASPSLARRIAAQTAAGEPITQQWLHEACAGPGEESDEDASRRLTEELDRSLKLFARSTSAVRSATTEYGVQLDRHVSQLTDSRCRRARRRPRRAGAGDGGAARSYDVSTAAGASGVLATVDTELGAISSARATLGAGQSRLESAVSNLSDNITNLSDARSRIEDTDYSAETTTLAKAQILSQASTAMLSQANQSQQNVLSLLR